MKKLLLGLLNISVLMTALHGTEFRKKVIQCGWDQRKPEQLLHSYRKLEQELPFDGLNITLSIRDKDGKEIGNSARCWLQAGWTRENIARDIEMLKQCQFTKFKHNFIYTGANGYGKRPGWFDDAVWQDIISHMALMAFAAKETGCVGLVFDPESYSEFRWNYDASSGRSFEETAAQARLRGAQMMKALAAEYPDMVILCYWLLSMSNLSSPEAYQYLSYGLYPAFINGLLDEIPPAMKLVDGSENGYWYKNKGSFQGSYQQVRSAACPGLAPEHREKYRRQVLSGFGIYLDSHVNRSGYSVPPVDGSQLRAFRYQLGNAIETGDEYTWVYGERWSWFHSDPAKHWETALPGIVRAIELARNPDAIMKEVPAAIADGRLTNLAKNPDFTDSGSTEAGNKDLEHVSSNIAGFTKYGKSPIAIDRSTGCDSPSSAVITGKDGILLQALAVRESESYCIRIRAKSTGKSVPKLSISWQTPQSTWSNIEFNQTIYVRPVAGSEWGNAQAFTQVPAGAGKLIVMLSPQDGGDDDKAWFDKLEIYKLDDLCEAPNTYRAMQAAQASANRASDSEFGNDHGPGQVTVVTKKMAGYWLYHDPQEKPGNFAYDNTTGFNSKDSARIAGMKNASICQNIKVNPGERYQVSIYGKKNGNGRIAFSVGWMLNGKWTAQAQNVRAEFKPAGNDGWQQAILAGVTVPEGVNQLVTIATASGQETEEDKAWFDKLEVYKQD